MRIIAASENASATAAPIVAVSKNASAIARAIVASRKKRSAVGPAIVASRKNRSAVVPFQDLLGSKEADSVLVLRAGDSTVLRSGDGRTESRLLSPGGADTTVEVYELKLAPKAVHKSEPHGRDTAETLVVLTGSLRLEVGDAAYELNPGDSVFFKADVPHSYVNPGTREARVVDVIQYQRA